MTEARTITTEATSAHITPNTDRSMAVRRAARLVLPLFALLPVHAEPGKTYDTHAFETVVRPCVELNKRNQDLIEYSIKHGDPVDLKASTGDTGCDILLGRTHG